MGNKKVVPINKSKKYKKSRAIMKMSSKRAATFIILIVLVFVMLIGRVGYLQFIEGGDLKQRAYSQSTASTVVSAKRGTIYDRNKKALAISAEVDTITVNPKYIVARTNGIKDEEKTKALKEK